jgi:hypothetical protein
LIRYALECQHEHGFEAWFRSSDDFDRQAQAGLLACPACGSSDVSRALMAPAVSTSRKRAEIAASIAAAPESSSASESAGPTSAGGGTAVAAVRPAPEAVPVAMPDPRALAFLEMLRRVRRHVEENSEHVGNRFPEEARKIHYGEADARGIYGEATRDEVEELIDEGIEIHALPMLPEERN